MDCNENGMFYQVQKNGDWISSNSDMYNDFLGIGTEKGFLGLRKVLYPQSYQMRYGRKQKIEPIKSIGLKPLKIDYGTPTRVTTTFGTKKVPTGLDALPKEDREDVQKTSFLSTLFGGQIDELLMSKPIPNFNEPADTTKRQTTRRTSLDETKDYHDRVSKNLNNSVPDAFEQKKVSLTSTYIPYQLVSYIFSSPILNSINFSFNESGFNTTLDFSSRPKQPKQKDSLFLTERFLRKL